AITRVDRFVSARAQVSAPHMVTGARLFRQRLTMFVGALKTAEVGPLAGVNAGNEERRVAGAALLRLCTTGERETHHNGRYENGQAKLVFHNSLLGKWSGA